MGSGRGSYLSINRWSLRLYLMMTGNLFKYAIASLNFIAELIDYQKWNIAYLVLRLSDISASTTNLNNSG